MEEQKFIFLFCFLFNGFLVMVIIRVRKICICWIVVYCVYEREFIVKEIDESVRLRARVRRCEGRWGGWNNDWMNLRVVLGVLQVFGQMNIERKLKWMWIEFVWSVGTFGSQRIMGFVQWYVCAVHMRNVYIIIHNGYGTLIVYGSTTINY